HHPRLQRLRLRPRRVPLNHAPARRDQPQDPARRRKAPRRRDPAHLHGSPVYRLRHARLWLRPHQPRKAIPAGGSRMTETASTDLIVSLPSVPNIATFTDEKEFDKLYEAILKKIDEHKPDVSTKEGRAEIKSLAYKIARTKTALDN